MSSPNTTTTSPAPSNPPKSTTTPQTFTLHLFASASTYTHTSQLQLPAPTTLPRLLADLERLYPGIGAKVLRSCALSVNLEYVDFDYEAVVAGRDAEIVVEVGDEVAVIPPVSAG